jgi:general secretion pathway protein K
MILRAQRRQRGVALVTALLIVALVVAIAASLNLGQQVWLRQMQNISDRAMANSIRHAALDGMCFLLEKDGKANAYDGETDLWAEKGMAWPVEGGMASFSVEDAQGRFNLNSLVMPGGAQPNNEAGQVFVNMLTLLGLDVSLKEKLTDWIDTDNMTRPSGADDTDYLSLPKPHRAANQNLASVDELRLVMGFDEEVVEKLRPYVIALPQNDTIINLNTAPDIVLAAVVTGWTAAQAQPAVELLKRKPLTEPNQINQLTQGAPLATSAYGVTTNYFLVTVNVNYGRFQRKTTALVRRDAGSKMAQVLWHYPDYPKLPKDDDDK